MKFLKIYLLTLVLASILFLPGLALAQAGGSGNAENSQTCPKETEGHATTLKECQEWILNQAGGGTLGYGENKDINETTLAEKVGQVIGMVLSVFGIVFFGLVVYSGIQWMTAGGNEEKVTHARERIIRAAIGLGIVMMAYALTSFIVSRMQIAGGGEVAQGCSSISTEVICTQAGSCFWDEIQTRCRPDCAPFNQSMCQANSNDCLWIAGSSVCANK